jgi:hypothetical protein
MGKIKSYIVFESNSLSDEDIKNQLDELYDQKSKIESKIHTLNKEISKRKTAIANTISKTIPKNHQKWSSENWNWILIHSHYDTEFEYRFRTNLLQSNFDKLYFSGLSPETNQFRFSIHFRDNEDKSQVKNIVKQSYLLIRHLTPYEINKNDKNERGIIVDVFGESTNYVISIDTDDVVKIVSKYSQSNRIFSDGDIKQNLTSCLNYIYDNSMSGDESQDDDY